MILIIMIVIMVIIIIIIIIILNSLSFGLADFDKPNLYISDNWVSII